MGMLTARVYMDKPQIHYVAGESAANLSEMIGGLY